MLPRPPSCRLSFLPQRKRKRVRSSGHHRISPWEQPNIDGTMKLRCKRGTFLWPFCTPINFRRSQVSLLECLAGTTGLEPATSAVTALREQSLQQLTTTRGLPKYLQVAQDHPLCGLGCGSEISSRPLPSSGRRWGFRPLPSSEILNPVMPAHAYTRALRFGRI